MNKSAALEKLGLTGTEDSAGVMRAYGHQLATAQEKLVSAQTEADRTQHQTKISELVEAYEYLTESGRYTKAPADDASATMMRSEGQGAGGGRHDTFVRMEPGAVISSRLEIGALLGSGGMGNVYAARDRLKDEDVAIKVLRQDLLFSTAAKERFLAEAKVSCNLSHPNIVRVYDVGLSNGHYYFSMERLKGHTLRQRIEAYEAEKRDFSVAEVTDIARQLMDALRYAHRFIVHRDLKPENIWLAEDGTVKLMDFGIARAYSNSQLTQTGMTLGTAYYMAPEQRAAAKEVDWRADQYALGVVLYEMLAGTIPMGAVKPLEKVRRDLPVPYAQALMRAMSPKPEDRWPSLNDLAAQMAAPVRKPLSAAAMVLIGVGLAAAAAAGIYFVNERNTVAQTKVEASDGTIAANDSLKQAGTVQTAGASEEMSSGATAADGSSGSPPTDPPATSESQAVQSPPVEIANATSPVESVAKPAVVAASSEQAAAPPIQVASAGTGRNSRRQECISQCERDDGECRSINRRGRQECMRAVGFGGSSGRITPSTSSVAADCAFFGQGRCGNARNRDACVGRMTSRYAECVAALNGSVVSRRQDCEDKARESDRFCLDELRDCRASCE
jgi:serine/threonine protein kinase